MTIKPLLKRALETTAAVAGPHRWPRQHDKLVALMYHRVLPREDPRYALEQPGMVVTPETFRAHLRWIKQYFRPIALPDWIHGRLPAGPSRRPYCAITFDDGWRDNYEFAFPLLREAGLPATVFLVSDFVGSHRDFWPGRVQKLLARLRQRDLSRPVEGPAFDWLSEVAGIDVAAAYWDQEQADELIVRLKAYSDGDIESKLDAMERALDPNGDNDAERVLLSWPEVQAMVADGTFTVGSHTRRHRRLSSGLSDEELASEIVESGRIIAQRAGVEAEVFCYPNGDRSPRAERLVRAHYRGACTTRRAWTPRNGDPFEIGRVSIHEDMSGSRRAFLARASALF